MNKFNKSELTILLAYYFFDSKKNDNNLFASFVEKFNYYFKCNINNQVINYQLSLFKSVDTSFNAINNNLKDKEIFELWDYYISQDRLNLLRAKYKNFKALNYYSSESVLEINDNQAIKELNSFIERGNFTFIEDTPKTLYSKKTFISEKYKRDIQVSMNALVLANYECEYSSSHKTFVRKNSNHPYTECHHLIPLEFQGQFEYNLDVEANVVSLCSNCHNHLHYGKNPEEILIKLFTKERKERLLNCCLEITLDELIRMYK